MTGMMQGDFGGRELRADIGDAQAIDEVFGELPGDVGCPLGTVAPDS